jgi:succinoglycan biosynthesis transport protein ExoP
MTSQSKLIDWRIWWQIFWRKKFIIAGTSLLTISLGLFYALTTPPEYASASTIMYVDFDVLMGNSMRVPGAPQREDIESFRRRITSLDFMVSLLDSLDIQKDPKVIALVKQLHFEHPEVRLDEIERQVYIDHLQKRISTRMKAYNLVEIKATGRTSDDAYRLAKFITDLAISESQESQIQSVNIASSFSYQQLEIYKKKLTDAEDQLNRFNDENVTDVFSDDKLTQEKLQDLQSFKMSSEFEMHSKMDQMQELHDIKLKDADLGYQNELTIGLSDLQKKLQQRTQELCMLMKRLSWTDVEVIQINEDIAQLKRNTYNRVRSILSAYYTGKPSDILDAAVKLEFLKIETGLLQKTCDALGGILQAHNENIRQLPSQQAEKSRLEREVAVNRQIYEMLIQQVRGTQIRESAQVKESKLKFKLIAPPQKPLERVKPQKRRIMMIACFLGLALGFGIVLGLEAIDASIKNVEDVTKLLGVPVLATIPRIVTRREELKMKRRKRILAIVIPIVTFFTAIIAYRIFTH